MSFRKNQSGFSVVELVIILLVVGALAFVGYMVYNRQQDDKTTVNDTSQSVATDDVPSAPEIKTTGDLDKASATLDQVDVDSNNDSSQLDSELSAF